MPALKTATKNYQKAVADEFRKWLSEHPKATRGQRIKKFDQIADELKGK